MTAEVKMSKSYLKKFIKYVKKVYHIEDALKVLENGRKNPLYTTAEAVLPVLLEDFRVRLKFYYKFQGMEALFEEVGNSHF